MGFSSLDKENRVENKGNTNGNTGEVEVLDSIYSECSSGISSVGSLESDSMEDDVTSSASSPDSRPPPSLSSSSSGSNSSGQIASISPLHDMSSLMQQLPIKRGLSKYFQGKSQSFASLTSVRSLEDLAKPENPYNKRLKSCKSYGGLFSAQNHTSSSTSHFPRTNSSSRLITKKASNPRGSCSSLGSKRRTPSFVGNKSRPPMVPSSPPHGSASTLCSFSNQTPLFV